MFGQEVLLPALVSPVIANYSLDIERSSSQGLKRTYSAAGDRRQWTVSLWFNHEGVPGGVYTMQLARPSNSHEDLALYSDTDTVAHRIRLTAKNAARYTAAAYSTSGVWVHLVWSVDLDEGTPANRNRLYIDGSEITSWRINNTPALGDSATWNTADIHTIGCSNDSGGDAWDGKIGEVHLIDGQTLDHTSFASGGSPIIYTGSYGNEGARLLFNDAGNLGKDSSGNGNDFSLVGSPVQSNDTPWPE